MKLVFLVSDEMKVFHDSRGKKTERGAVQPSGHEKSFNPIQKRPEIQFEPTFALLSLSELDIIK